MFRTNYFFLSLIYLCTACDRSFSVQSEPTNLAAIKQERVVALGKLIPQGKVIKVSVANAQDSRVNQILVKEGDYVKANRTIAILQGIERRNRDLEEAKRAVDFYNARLEQVKAGDAKKSEIEAQKANIASLEVRLVHQTIERKAAIANANIELRQANLTYQRNRTLKQEGAIGQQELDLTKEQLDLKTVTLAQREAQLNNTVQTLKQEIAREKLNLAQLSEVRPVDIKVAQTELARALVAVEQRQADLEDTKVKAPISGRILRINTRVGEQVNTQQGIVELGQTERMYAIAEVYETDIDRLKIGQIAKIKSESGGFEEKIEGIVEHIGLQIGTQQLSTSSTDPTKDENTRVVEVKISIDPEDSLKVASFTNMQVRVEIDTSIASDK